jgi:hypothetical protein
MGLDESATSRLEVIRKSRAASRLPGFQASRATWLDISTDAPKEHEERKVECLAQPRDPPQSVKNEEQATIIVGEYQLDRGICR